MEIHVNQDTAPLTSLPPEVGGIADRFKGGNSGTVYLIASDSGHSPDGEVSVMQVLEHIHGERPIARVFINCNASQRSGHLERGDHQLIVDKVRTFPLEDVKRDVGSYFVKSGRVTAALGFEWLSEPRTVVRIIDNWHHWAQQQEALDALDCKSGAIVLALSMLGASVVNHETHTRHLERLMSLVQLNWSLDQWEALAEIEQPLDVDAIVDSLANHYPEARQSLELLAQCAQPARRWYDLSRTRMDAMADRISQAMSNAAEASDCAVVIGLAWFDALARRLRERQVSFVQIRPGGVIRKTVLEEVPWLLRRKGREGGRLEDVLGGREARTRIEMLDDPEISPHYQRALDYKNAADEYRENKNFTMAFKCAERAVELCRDYSGGWLAKGHIAYDIGSVTEGRRCFEQAQQLDADTAETWRWSGVVAARHGDLESSARWLKQALKLNPADKETWESYRRILSFLGRSTAAAFASLCARRSGKSSLLMASADGRLKGLQQLLLSILVSGVLNYLGAGPRTLGFMSLTGVFILGFALTWLKRGWKIWSTFTFLIKRLWPALLFYIPAWMLSRLGNPASGQPWLIGLLDIATGAVVLHLVAVSGPYRQDAPKARLRRLRGIGWLYLALAVLLHIFWSQRSDIGFYSILLSFAGIVTIGTGMELVIHQIRVTAKQAKMSIKRFPEAQWARGVIWLGACAGALVTGSLLALLAGNTEVSMARRHFTVAGCALWGGFLGAMLGGLSASAIYRIHQIALSESGGPPAAAGIRIFRKTSLPFRVILSGIVIALWYGVELTWMVAQLLFRLFRRRPSEDGKHIMPVVRGFPHPRMGLIVGRMIARMLPAQRFGHAMVIGALNQLRGYSHALEACLEKIRKDPSNGALHYLAANQYILDVRVDSAKRHLAKAIALSPHDAGNYYSRGGIYWLEKDNRMALADFEKALGLWPGPKPSAEIYLMVGLASLGMYDTTRALKYISHAVQAGGEGIGRYLFWQYVARRKARMDFLEAQNQLADTVENEKNRETRLRLQARLAVLGGDDTSARQFYQDLLDRYTPNKWLIMTESICLQCLADQFPEQPELSSLARWWEQQAFGAGCAGTESIPR